MKAFCEVLEQLYQKVLSGATLENDSHDYVFYLNPALSDQDCSAASSLEWLNTSAVPGQHQLLSIKVTNIPEAPVCMKRHSQMSSAQEMMLFQLTVIKVMITRILSVETEIHAKEKYRDIIKILLQSTEIDSKLAFVKRKLIIFIKKCLLCKVGEDLCRGSVSAAVSPDHHLDTDMLALANAVLQTVHLGLLKTLSVDRKPSCFGGDEVQPGCAHLCGPDHVILRAASLITMKSLEIKFQNGTSTNEMKVDLHRFMSELLTFLKPHLQPSLQIHNPCEWLSRVFIEQDDDMLEAAKASMGIYLKLIRECEATKRLTQEKEMWMCHTHEYGYNPHCIFLFFLKNIGFDSTVLLDFLISSETCFLEYFVRYLKLLQKDWDNFFTICKFFDASESHHGTNICGCVPSLVQDRCANPIPPHHLTTPDSHRKEHTWISWASDDSSEPLNQVVMSKETHITRDHSLSSLQASHSLVDYDDSDDSEAESTNQCSANIYEQTSMHQEALKKIQDPAGSSKDKKELSHELQSWSLIPEESTTSFSVDCEAVPNNTVSEARIFYRIIKCFKELQDAICRLQKKNLFPYNPTALLKLLKSTEALCNKSVSPL
ncbi:Protein Lines-like protein 1 [Sciurus carolinensis]|uniref:Protein Lines-like protein 1 n=1 Tax=Sciurus carolinensis TaxID=30640 RepID=A0AA41SZM9_SCICA|nr:Protein Lines-like protein 1 [Sciurus carolinensis]